LLDALRRPDEYVLFRKREKKVLDELKKYGKVAEETMELYITAETVEKL
jgi:hypothetical protein